MVHGCTSQEKLYPTRTAKKATMTWDITCSKIAFPVFAIIIKVKKKLCSYFVIFGAARELRPPKQKRRRSLCGDTLQIDRPALLPLGPTEAQHLAMHTPETPSRLPSRDVCSLLLQEGTSLSPLGLLLL